MESLYRTHDYLLRTKGNTLIRSLFHEIDDRERLIGIVGQRGIGKTTFLLDWVAQKRGEKDRSSLYVNLNHFLFTTKSLVEFAGEFVLNGGRLLLLDQIFKYPNWQSELQECIAKYPQLQIIYTASILPDSDQNAPMPGKCYLLAGLSLREFVELKTGFSLPKITWNDALHKHREFSKTILETVNPCNWMQDYLHHGYYPLFLETRNYSENLLKNINMMLEVDLMYFYNIDQKLLPKLRKLLYLVAIDAPSSINVSRLAMGIGTSRSTVTNYVLSMKAAQLVSLVERKTPSGQTTAKTPSMVLLENSNLCYVFDPENVSTTATLQTFFRNQVGYKHFLSSPSKRGVNFLVDEEHSFRIDKEKSERHHQDKFYAVNELTIGRDNVIPLWLFGFLY